MTVDKKDLEEKADALERRAKGEMDDKNYLLALSLLSEARQISSELGFMGQVKSIEKKIAQIKSIMKFHDVELEDTPEKEMIELELEGNTLMSEAGRYMEYRNLPSALKAYEKAYSIFEKLNYDFQCQKIYGKIRLIKSQIQDEEPEQEQSKPEEKERDKETIRPPRERGVFTMESEFNELEELRYVEQEKARIETEILKISQKKEDLEKREKELREIIKEKKLDEIFLDQDEASGNSIPEDPNKVDAERLAEITEAERRRKIIREKMEQEKEKKRIEEERIEKIKKQEEARRNKLQEEEESLKAITEKQTETQELKKKAEIALGKGKNFLDKKMYKEAKSFYHEAINYLKTLGWFDQVEILYNEIKNIEKYEIEHLKEEEYKTNTQNAREEEFQERIKEVKAEKKKEEQERLAKASMMPPELKIKVNKALLALEKAEQEESEGQIGKAIGRYQFALNIYKSISTGQYDFNQQISEIEAKIEKLKSKS